MSHARLLVARWVATTAVYTLCYPALHWLLQHQRRYKGLPTGRQRYVVSNLLKGVLLGLTLTVTGGMLWDMVVHNQWHADALQRLAPVYCALDLVSLFMVPHMHHSTVVHHVLVVAFGIAATVHTAGPQTLLGHICMYALFSQLAYFVNAWLAVRFLVADTRGTQAFRRRVSYACAWGYTGICALHWAVQLVDTVRYPADFWYLPLAFAPFVYDDVVLIRWLRSMSRDTTLRSFCSGGGATRKVDDVDVHLRAGPDAAPLNAAWPLATRPAIRRCATGVSTRSSSPLAPIPEQTQPAPPKKQLVTSV